MNNEYIAKMIMEIRNNHNLTQKDLADKFGVTPQAVSKWERGLNLPDIGVLSNICATYGYDINKALNNKRKSNNLVIYILLIIIIGLLCFLIYKQFSSDKFKHNIINSTCSEFEVVGSIAYNKKQTSIFITKVSYCDEDTSLYNSISAKLYKIDGKIKEEISSSEAKNNIKIKDYLDNVSFIVESLDCKLVDNTRFEIEISAKNQSGSIINYNIPLKINNDICV